jgi:hypothetical protein
MACCAYASLCRKGIARCHLTPPLHVPQEVFLTKHHLGIALEYADGGDLSEYIDNHAQQGVSGAHQQPACLHTLPTLCFWRDDLVMINFKVG